MLEEQKRAKGIEEQRVHKGGTGRLEARENNKTRKIEGRDKKCGRKMQGMMWTMPMGGLEGI